MSSGGLLDHDVNNNPHGLRTCSRSEWGYFPSWIHKHNIGWVAIGNGYGLTGRTERANQNAQLLSQT